MPTTNRFRQLLVNDEPLRTDPDLVADILEGVTSERPNSFQLTGLRTFGTSLIMRYLSHPRGALSDPALRRFMHLPGERVQMVYLDWLQQTPQTTLAEWLLVQLRRQPALHDSAPPDDATPPVEQIRLLLGTAARQWRTVLLFDHFDRALERLSVAQATELRPLLAIVPIVTATERPLAEINVDAAASLFSGQMYPLRVQPLPDQTARDFLAYVLAGSAQEVGSYFWLLDEVGRYPYYMLHGGAAWYDVQSREISAVEGAESRQLRRELARDMLRTTLRSEFRRLWNHSPHEQQVLHTLAAAGQSANAILRDPQLRPQINRLVERGLLVWQGSGVQFFAELWRKFVLEQTPDAAPLTTPPIPATTLDLTPREADVYAMLRSRPGQLSDYALLIRQVWQQPDSPRARHTLRQVIKSLREKIADDPAAHGVILNHHNQGYEYQP